MKNEYYNRMRYQIRIGQVAGFCKLTLNDLRRYNGGNLRDCRGVCRFNPFKTRKT